MALCLKLCCAGAPPCPTQACFSIGACGETGIAMTWSIAGPGGPYTGSGQTACTPTGVAVGTYTVTITSGDVRFANGSASLTISSADCVTHSAAAGLTYIGTGCCSQAPTFLFACLVETTTLTLTSVFNGTGTLTRDATNHCQWAGTVGGTPYVLLYDPTAVIHDWYMSANGVGGFSPNTRHCHPFGLTYTIGFDTVTISP